MSYTERFTEVHKLLARLHPATRGGNVSTEWVSMRDYHRAVAIISTGYLNATLDAAVWQATDLAGTSAKIVTGKAITQLAATDDEEISAIEVRTEELDVDGGFDCIRVQTSNGAAASNVYEVLLFGTTPRFAAVGTTEWDEVVD